MVGVNADFGSITTKGLGLVISEYTIESPDIQEHKLEIVGRDGNLDLSGAYGKIAYRSRKVTINLHDTRHDRKARRDAQRKLISAIHGKNNDLVLSDAPEYTIRGRWHVDVTTENRFYTEYTITGDCYPFRYRGAQTYLINAAGGLVLSLPSGDQMVNPTIEVDRRALVTFGGKTYWLEAGSWKIRDIWFVSGENEIIINTYPDYSGIVRLSDLAGKKLSYYAGKRLYDIAAGENPVAVPDKLSDYAGYLLRDLSGKKLVELAHYAKPGDLYSAYIQYDWSDF